MKPISKKIKTNYLKGHDNEFLKTSDFFVIGLLPCRLSVIEGFSNSNFRAKSLSSGELMFPISSLPRIILIVTSGVLMLWVFSTVYCTMYMVNTYSRFDDSQYRSQPEVAV
jgi:hypothetical protein